VFPEHPLSARAPSDAVAARYFDQFHFIREFRSVIGQPPRQFFRAGANLIAA
jgi:AraC-like DNA-binding protein